MDIYPSAVLRDPSYTVPRVPDGSAGLAWIRAHVARFSEGTAHRDRRGLVERVIAEVGAPAPAGSPTATLLRALGLPEELEGDVARAAAAYQPHLPPSPEADAAADRLVVACGGRTEESAARVCVLLQAHAATLALVESRKRGDDRPAVPTTRRVDRFGREVLVDLTGAPFGDGPHRCPGESLALHLAAAVTR